MSGSPENLNVVRKDTELGQLSVSAEKLLVTMSSGCLEGRDTCSICDRIANYRVTLHGYDMTREIKQDIGKS